jgi:recombination protein RecA
MNTNKLHNKILQIENKYGKILNHKGTTVKRPEMLKIKTGVLALDVILNGGWSCGRQFEIFGWESVGKTTLMLHTVKEALLSKKVVAYFDTENTMDWMWAKKLGVDKRKIYTLENNASQFVNGVLPMEDLLDLMIDILPVIDIIIIDSVAGLVPRGVLSGNKDDYATHPMLLSKYLPILQGICRKTNHSIFWTNQLRCDFSGISQYKTTGGNSLKYWCSQRLELKKNTEIYKNGDIVGVFIDVFIVKSKVDVVTHFCNFPIYFDGRCLF